MSKSNSEDTETDGSEVHPAHKKPEEFSSAVRRIMCRYGEVLAFSKDVVITRSLDLYGEWAQHEISLLGNFIEGDTAVIDVGANIGTHSMSFALVAPDVTVLAIEPQPRAFALLVANCAINKLANVKSHNLLCGSYARVMNIDVAYDGMDNFGAVAFKAPRRRLSWSIPRIRHLSPTTSLVQMIPLDTFEVNKKVSLLKIDVEGMELNVLRGSQKILRRHRPAVYFEQLDTSQLASCKALLENQHYHLFWMETHPFNKNNFRKAIENVWWRTEMGILAVPREFALPFELPPVTGNEKEIPFCFDARKGIAVPN